MMMYRNDIDYLFYQETPYIRINYVKKHGYLRIYIHECSK